MTTPQTVFPLRSATGVALVVATVLASTIGFLNAYMINVAVPAIGRDLDADVSAIQWVLTGYLVTVAALLLVAGALADHFGRRRILIVGLFSCWPRRWGARPRRTPRPSSWPGWSRASAARWSSPAAWRCSTAR